MSGFSHENLGIRISSITHAIAKRYSTPSQLVGRQALRLREEQTRAIRNVYDGMPFLPGFLVKSTHAQTVITRPLTEGCGLEARLDTFVFLKSCLSVMEDFVVFYHCFTLCSRRIQTSGVAPKVYQLVHELLVQWDKRTV